MSIAITISMLGFAGSAAAAPLHFSAPRQIDDESDSEAVINAVSCVTPSLCVAVDDDHHAFAGNPLAGRASWNRVITPPSLSSLSCVSPSLCVAGGDGAVDTSSQPGTAGSWTDTKVDGDDEIQGMSCRSATFCVGADFGGNVVTSVDPTGGPSAWTVTHVDGKNLLEGISCPTTTLCAAVDDAGNVVVSTNPMGGASAWTVTHEDNGKNRLESISCPTSALCVAVDDDGNVLTSSAPGNVATPWTITPLGAQGGYNSVSCAAGPFCVAIGGSSISVTTNPTGGASAWTSTPNHLGENPNQDVVDCITGPFCIAGDADGDVYPTANPISGVAPTWTLTSLSGPDLSEVACPSQTLCLAVDSLGQVVFSTAPATASLWSAGAELAEGIDGLSCASGSLCVAASAASSDGGGGETELSTTPTGRTHAWKSFDVQEGHEGDDAAPIGFGPVSCVSAHLCAMFGENGFYFSTSPSNTKSWKRIKPRKHTPAKEVYCRRSGPCAAPAGSCPSRSLCVALDGFGGKLMTTKNPAAARPRWSVTTVDPKGHLTAVTCPSTKLCVAVDDRGNVLTTTQPTRGSAAWTADAVDEGDSLEDVSCASSSFCVAVDEDGYAVFGT